MSEEKKFCDMSAAEKIENLRLRVNQFHMLQLPGQPYGMHMGTCYLVNDLLRTLEAKSKTKAVTTTEGSEWQKFEKGKFSAVHSIIFDDGSVWDSQNGWRR